MFEITFPEQSFSDHRELEVVSLRKLFTPMQRLTAHFNHSLVGNKLNLAHLLQHFASSFDTI
jgi:hypothetical protein